MGAKPLEYPQSPLVSLLILFWWVIEYPILTQAQIESKRRTICLSICLFVYLSIWKKPTQYLVIMFGLLGPDNSRQLLARSYIVVTEEMLSIYIFSLAKWWKRRVWMYEFAAVCNESVSMHSNCAMWIQTCMLSIVICTAICPTPWTHKRHGCQQKAPRS